MQNNPKKYEAVLTLSEDEFGSIIMDHLRTTGATPTLIRFKQVTGQRGDHTVAEVHVELTAPPRPWRKRGQDD